MSKKEDLLRSLKDNLGEWTCAYCGSNSNQPAATFRELKKLGYKFEEVAPQRWGKTLFCPKCNTERTHYKLLSKDPIFDEKNRITISEKDRKRILNIFQFKDAFTGASISSTPEIDHKEPWTRMTQDVDASLLSDDEIKEHFQLLTREHNLLKDRACGKCKEKNMRTPFFEIPFWYEGDSHYEGTCVGCGWYDGKMWREELVKYINKEKDECI